MWVCRVSLPLQVVSESNALSLFGGNEVSLFNGLVSEVRATDNEMFSQSSLDAPDSPPGFRTHVLFNNNLPVNTLAVNVDAIDSMHGAVQNGWTVPADAARRNAYCVNLAVPSTAPPTVANQLQTRHVVLGLLQTIHTMIEPQRFCLALAHISFVKGRCWGVDHREYSPE
ncbi:hypothetical protein BDR22DRAFT_494120 [Usnea florida]